jgi:uncharacterized protein YndB with AHSA1/START domain
MNPTLMVERSIVIAAPREKVWRALTTPEHFSTWFEGDIRFDRLATGTVMTFNVGGENGIATMTTVEPPAVFAFTWTAEANLPTLNLVTFRLEAVPEGTHVTVTEQGFEALPENLRTRRFEMNDHGWEIQLHHLDNFVQKMPN